MTLTVIVPCAGRSTRFSGSKAKPFLTHPNGSLMLMEALVGLDLSNVNRLILVVNREHIEQTKIHLDKIQNQISEFHRIIPEFCILDTFTASQSETIYQTINIMSIEGAIFIKDCDNQFKTTPLATNSVCISSLCNETNAINKSYVSLDKFGYLNGIVEKSVISDKFCCGGYAFTSVEKFTDAYLKISNIKQVNAGEIYISHIVQQLMLDGERFEVAQVDNYYDWGTIQDWITYTSKFKTIFLDLDGTVVENSSEYFDPVWGNTDGLTDNIGTINTLYESGFATIIITTSRKEIYKDITIQQLQRLGIKYHRIIFDLPHSKRIVINDYADTNPYPSAIAINLKRNEDKLKDYLK